MIPRRINVLGISLGIFWLKGLINFLINKGAKLRAGVVPSQKDAIKASE